jgi:hypothetical protein
MGPVADDNHFAGSPLFDIGSGANAPAHIDLRVWQSCQTLCARYHVLLSLEPELRSLQFKSEGRPREVIETCMAMANFDHPPQGIII